MTTFFGSDYVTEINDLVFTPTGGQFGPDVTGFNYSEFFGVGEDDLVGDDFSIGGPVTVDIPFRGETTIFTARVFGEIGAQFGLQINSSLDPGSVDAILPYETIVAYPDFDIATVADGDVVDLFFGAEFTPEDDPDSGFTTKFPSFTFEIGIVTELLVDLFADIGLGSDSDRYTILDFTVPETFLPIFSLDTDREITAEEAAEDETLNEGDANPIELFGIETPVLVDQISGLDPAFNDAGEFAGIGIPLNTFVSAPEASDVETTDASPSGSDTPDEGSSLDLTSIDLGRIEVFVPNINTVSTFNGDIFVTDPTKKAEYTFDAQGDLVSIDRVDDLDADGNNLGEGNRDDLAALTLDLDGIITYATGGTFPPLELGPLDLLDGGLILPGPLGTIAFDAGFSYNLLDVELEAAFPLEQEFTLTPKLQTQLQFFDGTGGVKGAAKAVEVLTTKKVLRFDETGVFQDSALEDRLRLLAEGNATFAQDIDAFIDFNAGIPGAFTGQTASIGGRMIISRDGGATWTELFTTTADPIAESTPALGEDQTVDLELAEGTLLGYRLFIGSGSGEIQEDYVIEFDKTDSVYVEDIEDTNIFITETPFLDDLNTLNVVYDDAETFVEIVSQTTPTVTNRTGLEFDLALLLSGLQASAFFEASYDIGPLTLGAGIDFELGPLFEEKFELLNLEIGDLFNDSFQLEDNRTTSFVLGAPAPASDFGDAVVLTNGDDTYSSTLTGAAANEEIIALNGLDTIDAGIGNDEVILGEGSDTVIGGDGFDTLDVSDLAGSITPGFSTSFGSQTIQLSGDGERFGVGADAGIIAGKFGLKEILVYSFDLGTSTGGVHDAVGFERVIFSDLSDDIFLANDVKPDEWNTGGGNDRVIINDGAHAAFSVDAGTGDDLIVNEGADTSGSTIDGGLGHDYLAIDDSIDLENGVDSFGTVHLNFESVAAFTNNGVSQTFRGTEAANTLDGQGGNDTLEGRGGNDLLIGGDNDDLLIGGAGADSLVGGAGLDTADYSTAATSVFIDLDFAGVARGFRGDAQGDSFDSVENITASDFNDIVIGNNSGNTLSGGDGDDRLQSQNGGDLLLGGEGNDLLNRGTAATLNGNFTNVYDGGEGFDIVAAEVFDNFNQTGSTTGTASYTYRTGTLPFDSTTTVDRNVTIDFRFLRSAHVELTLDEDGDGEIRYVEDDASDRRLVTGLSGTAEYSSRNEPTVIPLPPFVIPDLTFDVRTSNFDYNITPKTYALIDDDSISFSRVSSDDFDDVNGTGRVTGIGSPPAATGGTFGTEQVINVEGMIGSQGNDRLTGNSQDNAFFGNGGDDMILGGGGDDRLGFGEAQALTDVFSFPGSGSGSQAPGSPPPPPIFYTLEDRLAEMDPNGTAINTNAFSNLSIVTPVGKIQISASGFDDIGSFLWGQGGNDWLDLRFDRGLEFFPDTSDTFAVVDLNIGTAGSQVNAFTGEVLEYGRATYFDGDGAQLNFGTTFGVYNVFGTRNGDTITGDGQANTIIGGDGADFMDGDSGFDTASYATASEGVTLNLRFDGDNVILDNARETVTGAGDATGDLALQFERYVGSEHGDVAIVEGGALRQSVEFPLTFDYISTSGPAFVTLTGTETIAYDNLDPDHLDDFAQLQMGAGDDEVVLEGFGGIDVDLGEGNDAATLRNIGQTIDAGAGNDTITILAHEDVSLQLIDEADRATTVDGGAGEDTVILTGGDYVSLEITDTGVIVTERVDPGLSPREFQYLDPQFGIQFEDLTDEPDFIAQESAAITTARYELTNVEFVVIDGERIRIDNPDPLIDADKTLTIVEDQIDPVDLGLNIPQSDIDAGATFEIVTLPTTAAITLLGVPLVAGQIVSATDMEALSVVPFQSFDPFADALVYRKVGDPVEDTLTRQLPDTVRGVSLNITSQVSEITVETVAPLPEAPSVALARLNPGLISSALPSPATLDYAETPSFADMPTGALTFEMLFRSSGGLDPDGPSQVFASYAVPGNDNEFLLFGYKDGRGLEVSFNGTRIETGIRIDQLYDRELHRISVTVDPDANLIEVLIDGTVLFSQEVTISGGLDPNGYLIFGQEQDAPGGSFNASQSLSGEIGDIRFWDGIRTDAEIQANAFEVIADPAAEANLVANWRADTSNQGVLVNAVGDDHLALVNSPDVLDVELPELRGVEVIPTIRVNVAPEDDQAIQVGGFPMPTGPMTIETIIQFHDDLESGQGRQHFISYAVDDNASNNNSFNEFLIFADQNPANPFIGGILNNSQSFLTDVPSTSLMDGEAHRFSIVYDPDADLIQMYIDGEQVYSETLAISPIATGGFLNFGQDQDGLGSGFQPLQMTEAAYGDMRVWDVALDAQTIAANAFAPLADPASETNLVANWQVDITNTTSVPDVLGGAALTQVDNPAFSAVTFPGTVVHDVDLVSLNAGSEIDDYIEIADLALPTGDLSLEWYYNAPDPIVLEENSFLTFISYATPANENQIFVFAFDNQFGNTINILVGDIGFDTGIPLTALTEGGLHRISITVDEAADELVFYIDGVAVFTGTGTPIAGSPAGGTLIFGQEQDEVGGGFIETDILIGEVGDIRIWNDVRTAEEIADAAFIEFTDAPAQPGLVANWQADTTTPNQLTDATGGVPMTVVNGAPIVSAVAPGPGAPAAAADVTVTTQVVDQQGDPVVIRVESVPTDGTVFFMAPDPDLLLLGVTVDVEMPVAVGDILTPAQLEGLFFRANADFNGDPGAFAYSITDDVAFRQLDATSSSDVNNATDGASRDGQAVQTITFDIVSANDAPEIRNLLYPLSPGAVFDGTLRSSDVENNGFAVELVEAPQLGTITVNPDGSFNYQQNQALDFAGAEFLEDTFSVRAVETGSGSAIASVDPVSSPVQTQTIRIINPDLQADIIFDPLDPDFFEADGTPKNIGGLATDDVIIGHAGPDGLFGFAGHDTIEGREEADKLFGGVGNDTLRGEGGDDTLDGGAGEDLIDGGEGIDTVDYSAEASPIIGILSSTGSSGAALGDVITQVENLIGTDFGDIIAGDSHGNTLLGGDGGDTISARDGEDRLEGQEGADRLRGGAGNDTLEGGLGNDILEGQGGSNLFVFGAGSGDDLVLDWQTGIDLLDFEPLGLRFVDLALTSSGNEALITFEDGTGGEASVRLTGIDPETLTTAIMADPGGLGLPGGVVNLIAGGTGSDALGGTSGVEDLVGLAGNDTLN
ncbi:MAG: LamG-like jellyroll fold domain-containing protein, partial [Pseudomonadota bacterium]